VLAWCNLGSRSLSACLLGVNVLEIAASPGDQSRFARIGDLALPLSVALGFVTKSRCGSVLVGLLW
jgi:hypothetical protein